MELSPIVERDRLENLSVFTNCRDTGLVDLFDRSGFTFLDDDEAGLAFNQSNDTMMAIAADDGIAFPMADTDSVVDFHGTVLDHAFSR